MYDILKQLAESKNESPQWLSYVESNFSEEQLFVLDYILKSFPESILIINGTIINNDVISVLALIAYDVGKSREAIKNLSISKSITELYDSIESGDLGLTDSNKILLTLLATDLNVPLSADSSIAEKIEELIESKNNVIDTYNYIKHRGTLNTVKKIIVDFFANLSTKVAFVSSITGNGYKADSINLINSDFIYTSGGYIYNTNPISILSSQDYVFSVGRDYTDGAPFTLTIETYDALEETLLDEITLTDGSPELVFDSTSNTYYTTFTSNASAALLYFNFRNNGYPYVIGSELEDVQLAEGSVLQSYVPHTQFQEIECVITNTGASMIISLGTLELLADDLIDYSLSLAFNNPYYTYNVKDNSILARYLAFVKPAGFTYDIQTISLKADGASPDIAAPTITLLSVDYINETYTFSVKNNSSLPVTIYVGDYNATGGSLPPEIDLYSASIPAGYTITDTRAADNESFSTDGTITKIEVYAKYNSSISESQTIIHETNNPLILKLDTTDLSVIKGSDILGGYIDVKITNPNSISVLATLRRKWSDDLSFSSITFNVAANSSSSIRRYYNPYEGVQDITCKAYLTDANSVYSPSTEVEKSIFSVAPKYNPDGPRTEPF